MAVRPLGARSGAVWGVGAVNPSPDRGGYEPPRPGTGPWVPFSATLLSDNGAKGRKTKGGIAGPVQLGPVG